MAENSFQFVDWLNAESVRILVQDLFEEDDSEHCSDLEKAISSSDRETKD